MSSVSLLFASSNLIDTVMANAICSAGVSLNIAMCFLKVSFAKNLPATLITSLIFMRLFSGSFLFAARTLAPKIQAILALSESVIRSLSSHIFLKSAMPLSLAGSKLSIVLKVFLPSFIIALRLIFFLSSNPRFIRINTLAIFSLSFLVTPLKLSNSSSPAKESISSIHLSNIIFSSGVSSPNPASLRSFSKSDKTLVIILNFSLLNLLNATLTIISESGATFPPSLKLPPEGRPS